MELEQQTTNEVVENNVNEEIQTSNEPQYSDLELQALEEGWVPQDQYNGDPDNFKSAKEFLRDGQFFKKIDLQHKELKELKRTLNEFKEHHENTLAAEKKIQFENALTYLKQQKKEALREGDADAVIDFDDKIELLREEKQKLERQIIKEEKEDEKVSEIHPELAAWIDKNPWYKENAGMRDFADAYGIKLAKQGVSPSKALKEVEKAVREEFPHRFRNVNRDKPSAVEGTQQRTTTGIKLTAQETEVMKRFLRAGVFKNEAEYIAEVKKQRDAERG
jgi:hypothetical protein